MQRILTRGEIETLDRTSIVRLITPVADTFSIRAQRLRDIAIDNPIEDYLLLIAQLADAQQQVFAQDWTLAALDETQLAQAQAHGMPPFSASSIKRDATWRAMLSAILEQLLQQTTHSNPLTDAVRNNLVQLADDINNQPELIEQQADDLLNQALERIDAARAPFIMAGLQVYWSQLVAGLESQKIPANTPFGLCPCCGNQPVSSTVMLGGPKEQIRYATCSLCSSQWHIVRVTCTHCEDTKKLAYHSLEEGSAGIKAESCDHCQHYRKIFYLDKEQFAEAFADDLASLPLDILMGEANFYRANNNPYLWQLAEQ
ncbi:formate dehydrogenase accessory protein FdhE [Oceanisphaera profunda]|uniref:Protein FdhE homolog n=1 Tax=Oceanisphaera profunda TaxID=1416627 RepID=A0A1Y0D3H9_9GAMM|nr:formate dehydrogenase accessory protein FdhE [Oceanisphaera profunda]ART82083.1 formate dehydrogenase accessory protein FdhE [Oceanisphaera profunda]